MKHALERPLDLANTALDVFLNRHVPRNDVEFDVFIHVGEGAVPADPPGIPTALRIAVHQGEVPRTRRHQVRQQAAAKAALATRHEVGGGRIEQRPHVRDRRV